MSKSKYGRNDSCWEYRTTLEKILIGAIIIAFVVALTLLVVMLVLFQKNHTNHQKPSTCSSPQCLHELSQLIQRVDPAVNPCDDFYNFACGSLLKNAHGDEKLGSFFVIQNRGRQQIQEMYNEPLKDDDHRVVKVAKKLYRACMDEPAIERDGLESIRTVIRAMGGWPVVEGNDWDGSRFSWIAASYKLRELGYFYSSFMSVALVEDPLNANRFMFKMSLPDAESFDVQRFDKQQWMVDAAVAFGAEEGRALIEMAEMHQFMLDMRRQIHMSYEEEEPPKRLTASQFYREYNVINWKEFINNIIGPKVRISSQDYVLFPSVPTLQKWLNFIARTPKRTQANYMIWRAIENTIPYLPELQTYKTPRSLFLNEVEDFETRPDFCIGEVRKRFSPSPVDVMFVQKHLPLKKRTQIKDIINQIKVELVGVLKSADWMDATQKQNALQRVQNLSVIVGAPDDYFEEGVLDDLDFDVVDTDKNQTFLNLLSLVDKNHQSWLYSQLYSTKAEFKAARWNLETASVIGDYSVEDNVISLPATIFQDMVFNDARPKYLNYGNMGTIMGHHLLYVFEAPANIFDMDMTQNELPIFAPKSLDSKRECIAKQTENFYATSLILQQALGLQVSYAAYTEWSKSLDAEEPKLLVVDYTPKQMFWMSAASYFCQPVNPYSSILRSAEEKRLFSLLVSVPMLNNLNFGRDFSCPLGSQMNPVDKCETF